MKKYFVLLIMAVCAMSSFAKDNKGDNPFFKEYNTPFGVPPFDKIKTEHYMPALKEGMKIQTQEIKAIVDSKEAPTFKNVIEAMEFSGEILTKVSTVFFNMTSCNTNKDLQQIAQEVSPLLTKHSDDISLNEKLFAKVKAVYDNRAKEKLNPEQLRVLTKIYKDFARNGANLSADKKDQLRKINTELSLAELKFGDNVLAETNNFQLVIDKESDLAGLPESLKMSAADEAKEAGKPGKWLFTLHNPSVMPFLQYAQNRDLRKKIEQAYVNRANNNNANDNKEVIKTIINLRQAKAKLLGYKNFAEYTLENTMAGSSSKVFELLNKLWTAVLPNMNREEQELQKMVDAEGGNFKLEAWDWRYYAEKLRKEKYDLDEDMTKPYFKLENVRDGVFSVVNKLYGLKFVERKDIPTYHPDVVAYEVLEANGKHLGVILMDFFPRASKRSGAWMNNYRDQIVKNGKFITPIVTNVFNFTKPTGDMPALLTADEVETFFHEFGHGLHGLFSNCTYPSVSGTNVSRDFVELPSQVMENWAFEPEVLKMYAKHYKTGEVIPQALIDKLQASSKYGQGFGTGEYLAASLLDMYWHTDENATKGDVNQFENGTLKKLGLIPQIESRYRSTYFQHAFSGGYSAGYYSYIWAGVLDTDAFQAFKEKNNLFDQATAKSFRENLLSRGNTEDPMKLYKTFRGREPQIEPLLIKRGLK